MGPTNHHHSFILLELWINQITDALHIRTSKIVLNPLFKTKSHKLIHLRLKPHLKHTSPPWCHFTLTAFCSFPHPPKSWSRTAALAPSSPILLSFSSTFRCFVLFGGGFTVKFFLRTEMLQTKKHLSFFFCESLLFWLLADFFSQARGKSYYHTNTPLDPKTMKHVGSKALKIWDIWVL